MIKKAEIFLVFCLLFGILLMLLHLEGSAVIIGLSVALLSMLYFPFGFFYFNSVPLKDALKRQAYKQISFLRGVGSVGAGFVLSVLLTGTMFRLLHLEGSGVLLLTGLTSAPIILIVLIIKFFANTGNLFYRSMLIRAFIIIATAGIFFLPAFLQNFGK